jgi:hypothetical protein
MIRRVYRDPAGRVIRDHEFRNSDFKRDPTPATPNSWASPSAIGHLPFVESADEFAQSPALTQDVQGVDTGLSEVSAEGGCGVEDQARLLGVRSGSNLAEIARRPTDARPLELLGRRTRVDEQDRESVRQRERRQLLSG